MSKLFDSFCTKLVNELKVGMLRKENRRTGNPESKLVGKTVTKLMGENVLIIFMVETVSTNYWTRGQVENLVTFILPESNSFLTKGKTSQTGVP